MKTYFILFFAFISLVANSQECNNCCNDGYKDFLIVTKNGVKIGFKVQKTTNNKAGLANGYSVIAYAHNTNDYQLYNRVPAVFKIVGVTRQNIPGVTRIMNVKLGANLPPNSGIIREEYFISIQEPRLELNGLIQGIWRRQ